MALNIPDQHAQIGVRYVLTGDPDPIYVTMGVENTGAAWVTATDIAAAASYTAGAWGVAVDGITSNLYSVTGATWRGTIVAAEFSGTVDIAPDPGLQAGNPLPQNCAVLVRKVTAGAVGLRSGRMYLPGAARETEVDGVGKLLSTEKALVQTEMNNFLTAMTAGNLALRVLRSPTDSNPTGIPSDVTGLTVQDYIATQRTRLRR